MTDVTGIYFQYRATAIGEMETQLKEILEKEYDEKLDVEEGLKLAVSAFKRVFGKDFDSDRLDGAFIKTNDRTFRRIDRETIRKLGKKV